MPENKPPTDAERQWVEDMADVEQAAGSVAAAGKPTPRGPRSMSRQDWLALGARLYGDDPRKWKFRCVFCGNVQSHESVKARNPAIGDTSNWIFFSCEGRHTKDVGCDWTLGGLFRIHKLEVIGDRDGTSIPVFEFADEEPAPP